MKRYSGIVIGGLVLLLTGCGGKQAPQIPSQRKAQAAKTDVEKEQIMHLNQQLAETVGAELERWVQAQEEEYELWDANTWVTVLEPGDTSSETPKEGEKQVLAMRIYTLNGELLAATEQPYRIGKQELPQAVDKNVRRMHKSCKARMVAPWYSAYGVTGTVEVPPYENIVIEIELK